MVDGAVFAMFARQEDSGDRLLEFDFEFVGADTTRVQVTVHIEDAQGRPIKNVDRTLVDLGFDAAAGVHTYDVVLTGTGAVFRVDGETVAYFSEADMPGGVWYTGDLESNLNRWAGDQRHTSWAGAYTPTATPITGRVTAADIRSGDLSGDMPILGKAGNDILSGTSGRDVMDGLAGHDSLDGGAGNDRLMGGHGDNRLHLDAGYDWINGGSGSDWLMASGSAPTTVNLARMVAQDTGYGFDQIRGIEHVLGGSGANNLTGDAQNNSLIGGGGNDSLYGVGGADQLNGQLGADLLNGGAGADVLDGGSGADRLFGGQGADTFNGGQGADTLFGEADLACDIFVFTSVSDSAPAARDIIRGFELGIDDIDLIAIDANLKLSGDQAFAWGVTSAIDFGVWTAASGSNLLLRGDVTGDRIADFEIQLNGITTLGAGDLLL